MNLALQIGDSRVPCDRVLQQLYDSQLLPQLLREIVIDELIDRVAGAHQIDLIPDPEEFDKLFAQVAEITPFQGMNSEQIEAIALRTLKLHKFKQAGWGHKVSGYYQTIQHQLYRVCYSMMQVEDGVLAQELFFRIQAGEQSFAELAIQYSQAASAQKGGLIGPILSREIPPEIGQILQQLAPGELSPLFRLDGSYGFIRLNDVMPPQLNEHMHQVLLDELFENWIQEQIATEVGENGQISIAPTTTVVEQPPELAPAATANIEENDRANPQPPLVVDLFAPDFAYREPGLAQPTPPESQPSDTPEVTVVTEPEAQDLQVSSSFFFPDRQSDPQLPAADLTMAPTATDSANPGNFVLHPDLTAETPAIAQTQRRSRLLVTGIVMLIAPAMIIMGIDRFTQSPNLRQLLPEPIRTWVKGS